MFKDDLWEATEEQVANALETYSFEEILELGDITPEEVLIHLVINGILQLPEVKNITSGYSTRR